MFARLSLRTTAAEIARARHIADVLLRNGLGFVIETIELNRFLPFRRARRKEPESATAALSMPQRVRQTLEELGPTYIKLGQILSTRPDMLPPEYIIEFSKLLDTAPAVETERIVAVIERELGGPLESHFSHFDTEPLAAASIGQVHTATLLDGTDVVVKVQRPDVERVVQADLNLLMTQARFLEARSATVRRYGLVEIVHEFSQALLDELDYTAEGRNADVIRKMVDDEGVIIPVVYWPQTTRRVITLSNLNGIKLADREILRQQGYDLSSIADHIVRVYLDLVFTHGVFHADPHPANILVCDDRIGLVDFGVMGYLTPRIKEDLGDLLFALVRQNADEMVHIIGRMGAVGRDTDREDLRRDVRRLVVRYYNASLESLPMTEFLGDLMGVAFSHHIRLPGDLALLARTVVVLEGVARGLDPSLVLASYLEPFVGQLVRERISVQRTLLEAAGMARDLRDLAQVLPRRVDSITEQLERGDLTVGIEIRTLTEALRKFDGVGNRLAVSVIVASIIVGSALVLLGGDSAVFRLPFTTINLPVAQLGFVLAGLAGLWLIYSIFRSRGL